jgi:hypothetical protein
MNNNAQQATAAGSQAPRITYTEPAMERRIEGWPLGRKVRATALFKVEQHPTRGERATRVLMTAEGRTFAPKKLTYAEKVRIVNGSDGRTYIAYLTSSGFVGIFRGDMKLQQEIIHDTDARFGEVRALFENAPRGWSHVGGAGNE